MKSPREGFLDRRLRDGEDNGEKENVESRIGTLENRIVNLRKELVSERMLSERTKIIREIVRTELAIEDLRKKL